MEHGVFGQAGRTAQPHVVKVKGQGRELVVIRNTVESLVVGVLVKNSHATPTTAMVRSNR